VFERFTPRARQVVVLAAEEARMVGHHSIGTEHLLLGLLREDEGIAARTLRDLQVRLDELRAALPYEHPHEISQLPFTRNAKDVITAANATGDRWNHPVIGTEHVLAGLVDDPSSRAVRLLADAGLQPAAVAERLFATIGFTDPAGEASRYAPANPEPDE